VEGHADVVTEVTARDALALYRDGCRCRILWVDPPFIGAAMSAKKGSSAKSSAKSKKAVSKRSLRDLEVMNDKSKNIRGGAVLKTSFSTKRI